MISKEEFDELQIVRNRVQYVLEAFESYRNAGREMDCATVESLCEQLCVARDNLTKVLAAAKAA